MQIAFFTVFRRDPQHYLHACALVASVQAVMPDIGVVQLTDERTPVVPGVMDILRRPSGPMLERRLEHYASLDGDWLLVDTDVELRADVRDVFPSDPFDVALADRAWPHLPQPRDVLLTMPFNSGVVFCRNRQFWQDVLAVWRSYAPEARDWMSEQRAVWEVVRSGRFLVRILPGMIYNYPPGSATDIPPAAKVLHFKGRRKPWLTERYLAAAAARPVLRLPSPPVPDLPFLRLPPPVPGLPAGHAHLELT